MLPTAFWQGVKEFNEEQFYACHDTLESLWLESREPDKTFYQGILQIAVGCYHLENKNLKGAAILLGEGMRRLKDYQPSYEDVAVSELIIATHQLLKEVQMTSPEEMVERTETFKSLLPRIVKVEKNISSEQK